ncbi:hypothetical protein BGZ94_008075 [Podila epigama]|nr:hypothetical protein BGZ94_008075 [Podila epigama]
MGASFSRFRQNDDSNYEKILSDLDEKIKKAELRLSIITLREKQMLSRWLLYSVLAWFGYIGFFGLYLHDRLYEETQKWAVAFSIIILCLPIIVTGQFVISRWYKRKKSNEESQLGLLRADQRLKVEELKKKTAYYSTKTLLERYDPSSQRSGRPMSVGQDGRPLNMHPGQQQGQQQRQQQGQRMGDAGLRHRGPIAVGPNGPQGVSSTVPQDPRAPQQFASDNQTPNQPSLQQHRLQQQQQYQHQHPYQQQHPTGPVQKAWYDKIVDVLVGDEGPESRYALICSKCFIHNGLVLPQEIDDYQFVCKNCNFMNPSKKRIRLGLVNSGQSPSLTESRTSDIDNTLLQDQTRSLPRSRDPSPAPTPSHSESRSESVGKAGEGEDEEDMEFVSQWNDSEAVDSDEAKGYVVDSEDSKSSREDTRKEA